MRHALKRGVGYTAVPWRLEFWVHRVFLLVYFFDAANFSGLVQHWRSVLDTKGNGA